YAQTTKPALLVGSEVRQRLASFNIPPAVEWDLRQVIPGTNKYRAPDGANPTVNNMRLYRKMNFMCYLLEYLPYDALYSIDALPLHSLLYDHIIPLSEDAPDHRGYFEGEQKARFCAHMKQIADYALATEPGLTLRHVYVSKNSEPT